MRSLIAGCVAAVAVAAAPAALVVSTPVGAASIAATAGVAEDLDIVYFNNGRTVQGVILSESATEIRMEIVVGGIKAPATYPKADILRIERADRDASSEAGAGSEGDEVDLDALREELSGSSRDVDLSDVSAGAPSVYFMPLRGWFGSDIHPLVIEEMLKDAQRHEPDFLIIEIDRSWRQDIFTEQFDDVGQLSKFDEFSVADEIEALFTKEMPRTWTKLPYIVVWVKSAMGGAAFLPFIADEIYFHPDGRMGGVGNLGEMFSGVGDEVVRQKQRSLRLGRAQGMAIAGGYDYRIVTAMAIRAYELAYRLEGGKAVLFEGVAANPNEVTLTDDGTKRENVDNVQDLLRGTGNDVLTLKSESAKILGVSRGAAETLDDVLAGLGVLRNHRMIDGRAEKMMADWSAELDELGRTLPRMWREFSTIQVGRNGVEDELQAIGRRENMLRQIKRIVEKYGTSIRVAEGFGANSQPPPAASVPPATQIEIMLEQLRVQRMSIRP